MVALGSMSNPPVLLVLFSRAGCSFSHEAGKTRTLCMLGGIYIAHCVVDRCCTVGATVR